MAGRIQVVVNAAPDAVPEPPPNVLVAPRLPMLEIMARLDAVTCQAGQSTVNEALLHGVPLVVAPIRLGELATAEHVTRTGVGIAVSMTDATVAELAAAVRPCSTSPAIARRHDGWHRSSHRPGEPASRLSAWPRWRCKPGGDAPAELAAGGCI